jgi:hypothetical protein
MVNAFDVSKLVPLLIVGICGFCVDTDQQKFITLDTENLVIFWSCEVMRTHLSGSGDRSRS